MFSYSNENQFRQPERTRDVVRQRPLARAIAAAVCGLTLCMANAAQAQPSLAPESGPQQEQNKRQNYSIPAGPLAVALRSLASTANVAFTFTANQTNGKTTAGLQGQYTLHDAFATLLQGTGLQVVLLENGGYALRNLPADSAGRDNPTRLGLVKITGDTEKSSDLPPNYAGDGVARGASLGVLGNKDLMDTPFSTVSYTEQTIRNQQATSIAEVLTTTDSSVRAAIGSSNRYDALTIRGFRVDNDELALNGLYGLVPAYRIGPDAVERIELLKGPGSFLNGMLPWGSVGGGVNIVTKRAADAPLTRFTGEYVSDSRLGGHMDVGRRFGDNNEFGVRANGAFRDGDTRIDEQSTRNKSGSVGVDYRGEQLRVSADLIYQDDWMRAAARGYTPVKGIEVPRAPDPKINLAQSFDDASAESVTGITRADFDISQDVSVFGAIGANRFVYDKQEAPGATILNQAGDAKSTSRYQQGTTRAVSAETGIRVHVDTGVVSHQLVASANSLDQTTWFGQTSYADYTTNIYNPIRLADAGTPLSISPETKSGDSKLHSVAVADTLSIEDGLVQLTLGARRQNVETSYFSGSGERASHYDESATTPSVAIVVRPDEQLSLYANYIEALTAGASPPADATNADEVFKPYKSKQYEVGSKLDLGRFGATLSLFQITVPSGIVDPASKVFSLDGEQRNRGIELNGFGEINTGLRLLGGATWLDAELTRTQDDANNGNHAIGAPALQSNLGAEWDLPAIPKLTITGRAINTSKSYVSADNIQDIPGWTRFDLGARYTTAVSAKAVVLRLNVTNLFDKDYWEANPTGYLISGMPRTVWLSVATDF